MNIVFMGTPDFALPSLHMLIKEGYAVQAVVTQPDRPRGRKKILTPPPVKVAAEEYGLPVFQPERLKQSAELEQLMSMQPDFLITAAYGQILPTALLRLPRYASLNVHASLLPKYRGGALIHQAIIAGEKQTGVTIMEMVEQLDAGDIYQQVQVPIEEDDDVGTLHDKLSVAGAELLQKTIPLIVQGKIERSKQNEEQVSHAPHIQREDEQVHWAQSARSVYNQVRGLRPFPGAFTRYEGQVVKLWQVQEAGEQVSSTAPGEIYRLDERGIFVAAGDGRGIVIEELQPSGKKRMNAAAFLRGAGSHWQKGMQLGK